MPRNAPVSHSQFTKSNYSSDVESEFEVNSQFKQRKPYANNIGSFHEPGFQGGINDMGMGLGLGSEIGVLNVSGTKRSNAKFAGPPPDNTGGRESSNNRLVKNPSQTSGFGMEFNQYYQRPTANFDNQTTLKRPQTSVPNNQFSA